LTLSDSLLVSIITPCFNRAGLVADAVESVRQQDHPDVEHIVMDGGSTDGTLEVLGRYSHLRVFSQPDEGIYDALNKGLRLARGEVVGFLNTDDLYERGIFGTVAQAFRDDPEIDALVGGASIFYERPQGERVMLASFPCVPPGGLLLRADRPYGAHFS
jgi:glycosyltransferase involved in cell wall biosynthesis